MNWVFIRQTGHARWLARTILRQLDKRVFKRDSRMRLPTGRTIILPRQSSNASEVFVTAANCDLGSEALFARFADPERDMLDVGAHIGYYSLYVSPLVRQIYAFEPDTRNFPGLQANIAQGGNITHIAKAVSSTSGEVRFWNEGDSAVGHVGDTGIPIEAVSIDDFVRESAARPGLIKIDVEGHDLAVVQGARATIAAEQPLIVTEFNLDEGSINDPDDLFACLSEFDYSAYAYIWRANRIVFEPITARTVQNTGIKMLFLVPARLRAQFDALVGR